MHFCVLLLHAHLSQYKPQSKSIQDVTLMSQHLLKTERERSWTTALYKCLEVSTWLVLLCTLKHVLYICFSFIEFHGKDSILKMHRKSQQFASCLPPPPRPVPLRHHFPFQETWPLIHHIYIFCSSVPCRPGFYSHFVWLLSGIRGFPKLI